jgi:hypothetical protein
MKTEEQIKEKLNIMEQKLECLNDIFNDSNKLLLSEMTNELIRLRDSYSSQISLLEDILDIKENVLLF